MIWATHRYRALVLVGLPLLVGVVHLILVARRYYFGSFDDDASYVLTAKALLSGQGLTGHLTSGGVVVGLYAPGFSALISPLVWIWPHSDLPLRLFSATCFAAVFPLTWVYLRRRGVSDRVCFAALLVMALSPPFATFGMMVMAETAYLVVLLALLICLDRWESEARAWTWNGVWVVLLAGGLVWLKQAGIAFVAGVVIWLFLRRRKWGSGWAGMHKSAVLAGGVFIILLPVAIARLVAGVPLLGARYSAELGGFYQGGLLSRLIHVLPSSGRQMLSTAIPNTLVPYLEPLPIRGHWPDLWKVLAWHVTILVVIGAVVWVRRYRDAAMVAVPVYLVECILWPFVNERRVILVLPVVAALYVLGAAACWRFVRSRTADRVPLGLTRTTAAALAAAVMVVPVVAQMPRDYLFPWKVSSSHFGGSRYAKLLAALGQPSDVVETDYLSSVALFTGHQTNWSAFQVSLGNICYEPSVLEAISEDDASYLLLGDVNKPGVIDNACLLNLASVSPWAVELLHTDEDDASVFELIGPGTGNPDLVDDSEHLTPVAAQSGATWTMEWNWRTAKVITQASVAWAYLLDGPTYQVALQLLEPGRGWQTVDRVDAAVGDGKGDAPFLLTSPPAGVEATAMRVVAVGTAAGGQLNVFDAHALGPSGAS